MDKTLIHERVIKAGYRSGGRIEFHPAEGPLSGQLLLRWVSKGHEMWSLFESYEDLARVVVAESDSRAGWNNLAKATLRALDARKVVELDRE